jgi:DNA-binding response OmpR family regulator
MRVLVIDDDPDVRTLCKINLRYDGYEVIEAAGGAEGLELISSDHPDAVLLDVMMPNVDGIEVLRQLRANEATAGVPVVILSARVSIEDQIEGIAAGADDYLTKPFSPRDLGVALDGASRIDPRNRETERESRVQRLAARVGNLR